MKVLLLRPVVKESRVLPDLGLGYLAAVLRRAGHEVWLEDGAHPERLTDTGVAALVRAVRPDAVGLKIIIGESARAAALLARIRELDPGPRPLLLVGGPQVSGEGTRALASYPADYGFVGEAEESLPRLLDLLGRGAPTDAELAAIPGLLWPGGANPPIYPANLDALPLPAWDLIPPAAYPRTPSNMHARAFPVAGLIASRGCPFECSFCAAHLTNGRTVRTRGAANLVAEVELLHADYGVREFEFYDSNFTMNAGLVREFCRQVIARGWRLNFSLPNGIRLDSIDEETVALMARAGFYLTYLGIESGSPRVLQRIRKRLDLGIIPEKVRILRRHGFVIGGLFILGFPDETRSEMEETVACALALDLDLAYFQKCTPLPGTGAGAAYEAKFGPLDWRAVTFEPSTWRMPGNVSRVGDDEIAALQRVAYRRFYGRPRIIGRLLPALLSRRYLAYILTRLGRAFSR